MPAEPGSKTEDGERIVAFAVIVTEVGKQYKYRVEPVTWEPSTQAEQGG